MLVCGLRSTRRPGFKIFEAAIDDGSGSLRAVWLNQPFLKDIFMRGQHVVLYGLVEMRGSVSLQITNPQYEILDDEDGETIHTGRIVPVYEKTGTVTPKMQRRLVYEALQQLPPELPDPSARGRPRCGSGCRRGARRCWRTHFPPADVAIERAERVCDAGAAPADLRRGVPLPDGRARRGGRPRRRSRSRSAIRVDDRIRDSARAVLPFRLTNGQKQALKEIVDDLQRPQPMNRLLQGDVGAGKTIVALLAALVAMENGLQVAFMAPTEILAEQHFIEHLAAAAAVALPRGAADRVDGDARRAASSCAQSRSRAPSSWSSARTRSCRATCSFKQLGLVGHRRAAPLRRPAARDAARARGCIPTCW